MAGIAIDGGFGDIFGGLCYRATGKIADCRRSDIISSGFLPNLTGA